MESTDTPTQKLTLGIVSNWSLLPIPKASPTQSPQLGLGLKYLLSQ